MVLLVLGISEYRQGRQAMYVNGSDMQPHGRRWMGKGTTPGLPLNIMSHGFRVGVLMREDEVQRSRRRRKRSTGEEVTEAQSGDNAETNGG